MRAQSDSAQALAEWLERRPEVARVHFPGLAIASAGGAWLVKQQSQAGAVVAFEVKAPRSDSAS